MNPILNKLKMCKYMMMNALVYNTDDCHMGFIKFLLYNGGTYYLWFTFVGHSSGLLVYECDLYKKQYMEMSKISFDNKLFATFNLEMNFERANQLMENSRVLVTEKAALCCVCSLSKTLLTCQLFQGRVVG